MHENLKKNLAISIRGSYGRRYVCLRCREQFGGSDASDLEMPKTAKTQARYVKTIEDIADNVVYYTIGNILI